MTGTFPTTTGLRRGYAADEVDALFARARAEYEGSGAPGAATLDAAAIHRVAFPVVRRNAYETGAVDAALDRLEAAFVARERAEFVAAHGQQAWMALLAEKARTLYGRLGRPDGERFAPGARGEASYDADDVDALCARLVGYFDRGEALTSTEVREARFRTRRGRDGYAVGPVDAFLTRAVEVLLGVE